MPQCKNFNRMLGIAALAMLFGATSAHAQSTGASGASGQGATSNAQPGTSTQSSGTSAQSGSEGKSTLSKSDQNIMRDIAHSNLAEIETGKIALSQSKNDQVRNFAQRMIDDHTQAQKELEQLAQAKGATLPTEPDRKHQAAAKKLSALEGDKFDRQYMAQGGLSDHRNTHRLLERAQTRATDPDLKALAAKMTPIVSEHLTMAQDLQTKKGSTSGSSMGPAGTSSSTSSGGSAGPSGDAGSSGVSGTSGSSNSTSPGKQ